MSELIDREALRAAHGLGADCHDCKRDMKSCQYDRDYSLMDFCEWLDDAPAASPWHRVEDGLPEPMVRCLIWDGYEVDVAYFVRGFYNSKADWYWRKAGINRKGGKIPNREVKKWMPIEPPKEDA